MDEYRSAGYPETVRCCSVRSGIGPLVGIQSGGGTRYRGLQHSHGWSALIRFKRQSLNAQPIAARLRMATASVQCNQGTMAGLQSDDPGRRAKTPRADQVPGWAPLWLVNTVHVWAAYREAETIFEIESMPAECLAWSPCPEGTSTAALRLPSLCPCSIAAAVGGERWLRARRIRGRQDVYLRLGGSSHHRGCGLPRGCLSAGTCG
jgi:hypothetical protein